MKKSKRLSILFSIILIIGVMGYSGCSSGGRETPQPPTPSTSKTTIIGTVLDSDGNAIESAIVTISSDPVTATTDVNGDFSAEVEVGSHEIVIKKDSEEIYKANFICDEGATCSLSNITTSYNSNNTSDDSLPEASNLEWMWVPFPEALCRDGSQTGIGVRYNDQSDKLMIYL